MTYATGMGAWASPLELLRDELVQCTSEGCVPPNELTDTINAIPFEERWNDSLVDPLYERVLSLEVDASLALREPNELAEIRQLRPDGPRVLRISLSEGELLDRLHGAWIGRCVGCALGKPVEVMGMGYTDGRPVGRASIKEYLSRRGDWPLADYFSGRDAGDAVRLICPASQRENIRFMEADDDIHYTLIALKCMEDHGPEFSWQDIARLWLSNIPISQICTAELQAITSFQLRSKRGGDVACQAAWTRRHRNPYREWIGAQIRSDGWAWMCAGKPALAAELAYRDVCWTHERNGIYGAMFFAALQAAAFVERDVERLVQIGLSEIPARCRLADAVKQAMSWARTEKDWESCMERVEAGFRTMSPVHVINNAVVCVLALFYGEMDPQTAISISVACGLDTDCNGATVGSVVGATNGRHWSDLKLAERLNDRIVPAMASFGEVTMEELAKRTLAQWQRVDWYSRAEP